mmetsp:Transcript_9917/g.9800  ORF Transcript_9917/g.9800 Transcript_9917/m.9800 type:complete len:261 (+) Transcript_9917:1938-2720(+)
MEHNDLILRVFLLALVEDIKFVAKFDCFGLFLEVRLYGGVPLLLVGAGWGSGRVAKTQVPGVLEGLVLTEAKEQVASHKDLAERFPFQTVDERGLLGDYLAIDLGVMDRPNQEVVVDIHSQGGVKVGVYLFDGDVPSLQLLGLGAPLVEVTSEGERHSSELGGLDLLDQTQAFQLAGAAVARIFGRVKTELALGIVATSIDEALLRQEGGVVEAARDLLHLVLLERGGDQFHWLVLLEGLDPTPQLPILIQTAPKNVSLN